MDIAAIKKAEEFRQHIGKIIRKKRKACKLKQKNLADMLGVQEGTVSRYESGKGEIKASTMAYISHFCHFDPSAYFTEDVSSLEEKTSAKEFVGISHCAEINPYRSKPVPDYEHVIRQSSFKDIQMMEYLPDGRVMFSAGIREDKRITDKPVKRDILYDFPQTVPLPLCDDDYMAFETIIHREENRDKLQLLHYGYKLMQLFIEMDTPYQTTSSIMKQILRRIIRNPGGDIDQDIYSFYWKCLYDRQG